MDQKTKKLVAGEKIHHFTVLRNLRPATKGAPITRKKVRVKCSCGEELTVPVYYLFRDNPKTHCGCMNKTSKTIYNQEYRIWLMMHVRTEDPRHEAFKHYGGRGITVCAEWHKDRGSAGFDAFLAFVGARPSPGHSIDRIDNDLGYQPYQADGVTRQIRWATATEQRANQRPRK